MDEQALRGFLAALWALARLIAASGILLSGLAFFFRALFRARSARSGADGSGGAGRPGARPAASLGPAAPRRPGLARLGSVCDGAVSRGYYRSLVAERLRGLGRDAVAMAEDLNDEEANRRLRSGASFLSGDAAELLFGDHFAARPRGWPKGLRRFRPWIKFKPPAVRTAPAQDSGRSPVGDLETPFLTRVDAYLTAVNAYMQSPGGNDGQYKD